MKKIISMIIIFFISFLIAYSVSSQSVYAEENSNNSYSREYLQEVVLSTAIQYYYKNTYSDYDYGKLNYLDFRWRDLNISPEEVSTTNGYITDCSAFAYNVYKYSLGNTLDDEIIYKDIYNNEIKGYEIPAWNRGYYTNFKFKYAKSSAKNFKTGAGTYGIGWYTYYLDNMSELYWNNKNNELENGEENWNDDSQSPFVFFYKFKKNEIENNPIDYMDFVNKLKPGDIIVASRFIDDNSEFGDDNFIDETDDASSNVNIVGGHVIIYIGNDFAKKIFGENTDIVALHASYTKGNYQYDSVPINFGSDDFSITTANGEYLKDHISYEGRKVNDGQKTYAVSVIRPINLYCNESSCELNNKQINTNAIARRELMYLKSEQYIGKTDYDKSGEGVTSYISTKYNSINNYDIITYYLRITNMDIKTIGKFNITADIPEGSQFVSCTYDCALNNNKVSWNEKSINSQIQRTYSFKVRIVNNETITPDSITFNGYNIEYNSLLLNLGSLKSNVNPTLGIVNQEAFTEKLKKYRDKIDNISFIDLNNNEVDYNELETPEYKKSIENASNDNKINLSSLSFIESLYYNTMGIDLGFLSDKISYKDGYSCNNISNSEDYIIKSALFKYDCDQTLINTTGINGISAFATRTNNENIDGEYYRNDFSNEEQNIQKMLVPGMYGGRALIGDDNQNRAKYMKLPHDLEFGDIVITFNGDNSDIINAYMYFGRENTNASVISYDKAYCTKKDNLGIETIVSNNAYLKEYSKNTQTDNDYCSSTDNINMDGYYYISNNANEKSLKSGTRILKEMYASNLFVVLRPTRLYGTTINYELNGGKNSFENPKVVYSKYGNLKEATRDGYEFDSWYSNNNMDANSKINEFINIEIDSNNSEYVKSTTIYANWNPIVYTISYNLDGGTSNNPTSYTIESNKITLNEPTKTGYIFTGWTGSNGNNPQKDVTIAKGSTGNKTYTANWEINNYTVTFNSDGGSSVVSQTVNYNAKVIKPSNPTKEGYKFKEWQLNGNTYDFNNPVTTNITLTAVWDIEELLIDILEDNGFDVSNGYVTKFKIGEDITAIKNRLGKDVIIESNKTVISTGAVIKKGNERYVVVIKGDLNGDGKVNSGDLLKMRKYLLEEELLEGAYKLAGIIESENDIKSLDLLRIRQYLLGEYNFK